MTKTKHTEITVADDLVMSQIYVIRGQKVMLDRDLASLNGVTTGNLNKAVNRNIKRFHVPVIQSRVTSYKKLRPMRLTNVSTHSKRHFI